MPGGQRSSSREPCLSSLVRLCIVHSFSPSSRTYPILPPIFHPSTPLLSLFATASSPPSLARSRIDRPPGRHSHLPAATARLSLLPMPGGQRSSSREPCLSSPVRLTPLPSLNRTQVCQPQDSPVQGRSPLGFCFSLGSHRLSHQNGPP